MGKAKWWRVSLAADPGATAWTEIGTGRIIDDEEGRPRLQEGSVAVSFLERRRSDSEDIWVPLGAFPEGNRATPPGRFFRLRREWTKGRVRIRADWARDPRTIPRHRKRREAEIEKLCEGFDELNTAMREQEEQAWLEPPCQPPPQQHEPAQHVIDALAHPPSDVDLDLFVLSGRSRWDRALTLIEIGTCDGAFYDFVQGVIGPDYPDVHPWRSPEARPLHIPLGAFPEGDRPPAKPRNWVWLVKLQRIKVIRRWTPLPDGGSICEIRAEWLGEIVAQAEANS